MNLKLIMTLILVILLSFLLTHIVNSAFAQERVLQSLEKSIISLVESTKPSLVTIEGEVRTFPPGVFSYFPKSLKDTLYFAPSFVGSGLIYSPDGYILTTTSVVQGMNRFKVVMPDGKRSEAKLIGTDDQFNIAVLKVDAGNLKPAKFGNSDNVKPGSWVTVVGNSYGLPTAVSFGVVNGIREDGFIQMSVNVSPGNSGGPVLSTDGSVVGLVSARLTEQSYINAIRLFNEASKKSSLVIPPREIDLPTSGISLAIPINKAKSRAVKIIKHGTIQQGYLGIYPEDAEEGVLIVEVVDNTPADKAGLKSGDIIIEYAGEKIRSEKHLRILIADTQPEEDINIIVVRNNKPETIIATIGRAEPLYGKLAEKLRALPPAVPDVDLEISDVPELDFFYETQDYKDTQKAYQDEMKKLKDEIRKISIEMEKLSKEIQKTKEIQEKAKEKP
ncbi:MAG: trypsin-like peptidase domain-containing protein [Candidatus Zixiibacteriota bacterium]